VQLSSIMIGGIERIGSVLLREMDVTMDCGDRMGSARFLCLSNPDLDAVIGQSIVGTDDHRASDFTRTGCADLPRSG